MKIEIRNYNFGFNVTNKRIFLVFHRNLPSEFTDSEKVLRIMKRWVDSDISLGDVERTIRAVQGYFLSHPYDAVIKVPYLREYPTSKVKFKYIVKDDKNKKHKIKGKTISLSEEFVNQKLLILLKCKSLFTYGRDSINDLKREGSLRR